MAFKLKKQWVITINKYLSYLLNLSIILAVLGFVALFIFGLYKSATS